ncbi:MAG: PEP-CTERM sorting domain-containing protein [Gammaproteobacteria bacterium]
MYKNIIKALSIAALISGSQVASASPTYNYERGAGVFGGGSGLSYDSVSASYNSSTEAFSFEVDYNGTAAAGGWLVVSPGGNPKNSTSELGIAYFDAASGDTWVYAYNGMNNSASYLTMDFLGFFEDSYTTVNGVATLSLETSSFSSQLDTSFAFGERIGIWFHPTANLSVIGDSDGLDTFTANGTGWLDTSNEGDCSNPNNGCITTVPEPTTWVLLTLGMGILFYSRRRELNMAPQARAAVAL